MRSFAFILGLALVANAASTQAATYRWVDRNGVVHYSDRPAPGAVLIETREAQTFSTPTTTTVASSSGAATSSTDTPQAQPYQSLEVFRPANDETIANSGNQVSVRLRLEPALQPGHSIWLYLDGKRVDGLPATGEEFTLNPVFRGTHTLTAVVTDGQGNTQITSPGVTFHMRQNSVLNQPGP